MIKLIIIGCGWAGAVHAAEIERNENTKLVAVVDRNLERGRALAERYRIAFFQDYREVDEAELEYQGVLISTPTITHFELLKYFIKREKNIFCEKPLLANLEELADLEELMQNYTARLGVDYNQRFSSALQWAKKYISEEKIHQIRASMYQNGPREENEYIDSHYLITDACCHLVDNLIFLNGYINEVFAFSLSRGSKIISDVSVNLRFTNNSIGTMTNTFVGGVHESQHPFQDIEIVTDRARYLVDNLYDGLYIYPHQEMEQHVWKPSVFERRDYQFSMRLSLESWIEAVMNQDNRVVDHRSFEIARANLKTIWAIIASLKQKRPVKIEL